MYNCFYCAYARKDEKYRFAVSLRKKILALFEETVISKFTTVNECKAYRRGIVDVVKILLDESNYLDCKKEYNKIIETLYNKIN